MKNINLPIDLSKECCIHQLFENQARKTPNKVAAIFEEKSLTYSQLDKISSQIAALLQEAGVGQETIVAIALERSLELIVAILGILKVGGAYLPLDLSYPDARLSYMLEDSQTPYLIAEESFLSRIPSYKSHFFLIDKLIGLASRKSPIFLSSVNPENATSVLYTSGSTGKPKGVINIHRGLYNRLVWMQQYFKIVPRDRVLHKTPISFDVSMWELFLPLISGSTLVIARPGDHHDPQIIRTLIEDQKISVIHFVPNMLEAFLDHLKGTSHSLKHLRIVCSSGEALSPLLVEKFYSFLTGDLYNLYGPTEASIDVTCWPCQLSKGEKNIPIGLPISNTQIHIRNNDLEPVAPGTEGEICISGIGLARGYLHREEETSRAFFEDRSVPYGRLYKTGDIGRMREDGVIEYLGRKDNQIKIRGQRIELGEIENILSNSPLVKQSLILPEKKSNSIYLFAYLIPSDLGLSESAISLEKKIRQWTKRYLPSVMVPTKFIFVEDFPLLPNGKIDQHVLKQRKKFTAPIIFPDKDTPNLTDEEKLFSQIWSEVLENNSIHIDDNFFEIGGDSISAIQVAYKAQKLGIPLNVRDIFAYPIIRKLAKLKNKEIITVSKERKNTSNKEKIPLTPIQSRFFDKKFKNYNHYFQSILLESSEAVNFQKLKIIFKKIFSFQEVFHFKFNKLGEEWFQSIVHSNHENLEKVFSAPIELTLLSKEEALKEIIKYKSKVQADINIKNGPLVRIVLFQSLRHSWILIIAHHLIIDAVSWRILIETLNSLYEDPSEGKRILKPVTPYGEWAHYLNEMNKKEWNEAYYYWKNQNQREIKILPKDFKRRANNLHSKPREIKKSLSKRLTNQLLFETSTAFNAQIQEILLLVLVHTLGNWTGTYQLYCSLESHGREISKQHELSSTMGWFTNIYPFLINLEHPFDLSKSLKSLQKQLANCPNPLSFGLLRYIFKKFSSYHDPEICFNYLGQWQSQKEKMFSLSPIVFQDDVSKENKKEFVFDINVEVRDGILNLYWGYNRLHYKDKTVEDLVKNYIKNLKEIIKYGESLLKKDILSTKSSIIAKREINICSPDIVSSGFYPLSPLQESFLYYEFSQKSQRYYIQNIIDIEGSIDIEHFKNAWKKIVSQHEIFRTGFSWGKDSVPYQFIVPNLELPWIFENWQSISKDNLRHVLKSYLNKERKKISKSFSSPLFDLHLLQTEKEKFKLIFSYPHILLDGWSASLILKNVFLLYNNFDVPSPPSYSKYISYLAKKDLNEAEVFWSNYLRDYEVPSYFSSTYNYEKVSAFSSQVHYLSNELSTRLKEFGRCNGLTLSSVLLGAWALLLKGYTQSSDIIFGMTVSGRNPDIPFYDEVIGLLINTLPMRIKINEEETLLSFLARLQKETAKIQEYGYVPLYQIQAYSSHDFPLFDNLFVFENYPQQWSEPGLQKSPKISSWKSIEENQFPISIAVLPDVKLTLNFGYDSQIFSGTFIKKIAKNFVSLLENFEEKQNASLKNLSILSSQEKKEILDNFSGFKKLFNTDSCIHNLFEECAEKYKDKVALIFEDRSLSYGELNAAANQLAHYLQQQGITKETPIAICLERSFSLIISLLAVLKAGGTYVPLDPSYPEERISYMLQDTKAPIIITQKAFEKKLNSQESSVLIWETLTRITKDFPTNNPLSPATPDSLAYIIYTSGSTGQPKGVMVEHQGITNMVSGDKPEMLGLTPESRILQLSSVSFDASVWDWAGALTQGAVLVLISNDSLLSGNSILTYIQKHSISHVTISAAMLASLPKSSLHSLKSLIVTGDVCPLEVLKYWSSRCQLFNGYGPTEATVCTTMHHYTSSAPSNCIGRPIANKYVYILDSSLAPVPIGTVGELYIGGVGLARGYLNNHKETEEKFLRNPFQNFFSHNRLYKTGDFGRFLANGMVEFIGRKDKQIKIRGFRVELGEIEKKLLNHPLIVNVLVVSKNVSFEKILIAYLVLRSFPKKESKSETVNQIHNYLKESIPYFMLPSSYCLLSEFPLTVNGKIDTQNLSSKKEIFPTTSHASLPRNEVENKLFHLWKKCLGHNQINIYDDFFKIGGHSLLALRLLSSIENEFSERITISEFYHYSNIAAISSLIKEKKSLEEKENLIDFPKKNKKPFLFLIHPITGLTQDYLELSSYVKNYHVIGIENPYFGSSKPYFKSLEEMANTYKKMIKKTQNSGPYLIGGWSFGGIVAFEIAYQLKKEGEEVGAVLLIDSFHPQSFPIKPSAVSEVMEDIKKDKPGLNNSEIKSFHKEIRNNCKLAFSYVSPLYNGRVILIKAQISEERNSDPLNNLYNGWQNCVEPEVIVHNLFLDHRQLLQTPVISSLVQLIDDFLLIPFSPQEKIA